MDGGGDLAGSAPRGGRPATLLVRSCRSENAGRLITPNPRHKKADIMSASSGPNGVARLMIASGRSSHRFDGFRQAAFMTSRLVLMHDFLVCNPVDYRNCSLVGGLCGRLVAGFDRDEYLLDLGTGQSTLAVTQYIAINCLAGAFLCRFNVCHWSGSLRLSGCRKKRREYAGCGRPCQGRSITCSYRGHPIMHSHGGMEEQ